MLHPRMAVLRSRIVVGVSAVYLTIVLFIAAAWAAGPQPPERITNSMVMPDTGNQSVTGNTTSSDMGTRAVSCPEDSYPDRGLLIGADHGEEVIHHDNTYVWIEGGPIFYQGTIPAFKSGNVLPDAGLLWHLFTRDETNYTIYATSSYENGLESALSDPFPLFFCYPTDGCTEQTVPVAYADSDQ
jgi:hypothetical protein